MKNFIALIFLVFAIVANSQTVANILKKHDPVEGKPKTYKWFNPFGPSTEWEAIINYSTANGFTLPTETEAYDQLIKDLKSEGIWQKLDVFYVFVGDGDERFKLINWKNPNQHYADAYGGLIWDTDGVRGNAINAYINTNYTASVDAINRKLGDASIFGVMSQAGTRVWGSWHATIIKDMFNGNYSPEKQLDEGFTNATLYAGVGFVGIFRDSSSTGYFISKTTSSTLTSSGNNILTPYPNTLLAGRGNLYGNSGLSCWATGGFLTYAETQTFRTIYNNFLTALGLTPIA